MELWGHRKGDCGGGWGRDPAALFWAGWHLCIGSLLSHEDVAGRPGCWGVWGPPTSPETPRPEAWLSPATCIQDGLLEPFLVILPHTLQPASCAGCQAAARPGVAVAELDKASASPPQSPPGAPSGGKAASSPGRSLSGVGAGRRAAPGASWPRPSPPGSCTLRALSDAPCADVKSGAQRLPCSAGRRGHPRGCLRGWPWHALEVTSHVLPYWPSSIAHWSVPQSYLPGQGRLLELEPHCTVLPPTAGKTETQRGEGLVWWEQLLATQGR